MSARSRNKGAQWERDTARALSVVFSGACRGVGQARAGSNLADVEGTPFWVECKVGKLTNPRAAVVQGEGNTDGRPVVAVCKDNSEGAGRPAETWVCMRFDTWLDLVRKAYGRENVVGGAGGVEAGVQCENGAFDVPE